MISATNRLLLLRPLATPPPAANICSRIGTHRVALSYRFPCKKFPAQSGTTKVHFHTVDTSRFLSTSAASIQVDDEDVSSAEEAVSNTTTENTTNPENEGGSFQQYFSRSSTSINDDKNKIAVSSDESSIGSTEEDAGGFKSFVSRPANHYDRPPADMPPEKVIRTGKIVWLNFDKKCGMILQDKEFVNVGPIKEQRVFMTFRQIYPELGIDNRVEMSPSINGGKRVKFQVKPNPIEESKLVAFNIRYEDGALIPLFHWEETLYLIQKLRAGFGHEVFDILERGEDANTIAKSIQWAKKRCDKAIDVARKQMRNRSLGSTLIKSQLGEEIFDLLSDISSVDDPETASDLAYFKCVHNLSMLGLNIEPSKNHLNKNGIELGFKGRRALTIKRKFLSKNPNSI